MLIRATRLDDGCPVILKLPGGDYLDRRRTLEIHREYAIARRVEGDGIIRVLGIEELSDRVSRSSWRTSVAAPAPPAGGARAA